MPEPKEKFFLTRLIEKCFVQRQAPVMVLFFLSSFSSFSFQSEPCEEVPVTIIMEHLGHIELPSFICDQEVFFSVTEIFDFFGVRNIAEDDYSRIEGFLINQNDSFVIDLAQKEIIYQGNTTLLQENQFIRTRTGLYLRSHHFAEIFGFQHSFNARLLAARMHTEIELPSIKAARREKLRDNIKNLQRVFTADTTIQRERHLFKAGAATWNINSTQRTDGFQNHRFNAGMGTLLAGGEFTGAINYNSNHKIRPRDQFYQWRYVNNETSALRQITAGKIGVRSIASIFNPIVGVQLTNTPTYLRRSFGTYLLSDYTKPDWIVELYINNVLVDHVQAEPNGFFSFDVPLMYGTTTISLRYYGPWGEEEISEQNIIIPFNFLPAGEFEYSLSAGMVEDGQNTLMAQFRMDYGLSNRVTLSAGVEFLSSLEESPIIPFVETSLRLPYNTMLSGQYFHEVGYKGNFSYVGLTGMRLDLNYSKFEQDQKAVRFSFQEERKVNFSMPVKFGKFQGTSRFIYRQNLFLANTYTHMEWLLSGRALGLRMNLTNTAFLSELSDPLILSALSTAIMLPGRIIFSPLVEYDYANSRINSIRAELRTQISRGIFLQSSYHHNFRYDQYFINLGVNFEFGFSRLGFNSNTSRQLTSFSQSMSGSLQYEAENNHLRFNNKSIIGRGSIKFAPFLDLNGNGIKDENEVDIEGVEVRSFSGGIKDKHPDGSTVYSGLEPYIDYHFKLDTRNLDRIAWRLEKESLNIYVNPNHMTLIPIPVVVVGEVGGFVYEGKEGIGGIKVNIFNEQGSLITTMISEADGYINFLGLKSGSYTVKVDETQLDQLKMEAEDSRVFKITNTNEGDYIDSIEIFLSRKNL